jgi:UDP-2,4-diacetamido-2,4,6-trideoxy-beta-L-altropyranose hydrolase
MNIAIRVDASQRIGTGHVMRCLTLAEGLRRQGAIVHFACRDLQGNMISQIRERGLKVHVFSGSTSDNTGQLTYASWLEGDWETDAEQCRAVLAAIGDVEWLIVDHYALDARWERYVGELAHQTLVIDDLADRPHECDMLLDQNLGDGLRYASLVPSPCKLLLGPRFALLRPEFRLERLRAAKRSDKQYIQRLLVFMGGADPDNQTSKALDAFESLRPDGIHCDVVVGASNPRAKEIESRCEKITGAVFHHCVDNMHELMGYADLGIFSAGSATWERCSVGLPAVVIAIAENQRLIAAHTARAGASVYLGEAQRVNAFDIAETVAAFLHAPEELYEMRSAALALVDGRGLDRVLAALTGRGLKLAIVSDSNSWINTYLPDLIKDWCSDGHQVRWVHDVKELPNGDCAFLLGCGQIAGPEILTRNVHNLVVHESPLPRGKGWAPLTWQVLEGHNKIPISILEVVNRVDSGDIYVEDYMQFAGHELCQELRAVQANSTIVLCRAFVNTYPWVLSSARSQVGESTFYRKRAPEDSRLDPEATLRDQFNLLRVVDNDRYPAFFELKGHRYVLKIERADHVQEQRKRGSQ